jgi:hypothetical protein
LQEVFLDPNGKPFMLPPNVPDPEPISALEGRVFNGSGFLFTFIQAAKIKSYAGAFALSMNGTLPPSTRLRGDRADAYACCYWGSLLGKFLGPRLARLYIALHESDRRNQSRGEAFMDAFNLNFGVELFLAAPPGLPIDGRMRRGRATNDSLAQRSVKAANAGQLLVLSGG